MRSARRTPRPANMRTANIEPFFAALKAVNPMPNTELEYTTVFELLTAVLLSAQATDVGVNKATRRLFPAAGTPQAILALGLEGLESYIRTIGLYRTKARNLMETCRILVERHGGVVPRTREELEELPGVGRKTANVVLNVAFGQPTMAVDTHIFRVSNRTGLAPGKTPLEVELGLETAVPAPFRRGVHHSAAGIPASPHADVERVDVARAVAVRHEVERPSVAGPRRALVERDAVGHARHGAAGRGLRLQDQDRPPRPRDGNRRSKTIRPGSDDDGVV